MLCNVLEAGLEPARASRPLPPQDSVSASSTTPATFILLLLICRLLVFLPINRGHRNVRRRYLLLLFHSLLN